MALRPDFQWLCEHRIVKSTVGVITNARPDHLDVMGPTTDDVAVALAGTVPDGGLLFTSEHERAEAFRLEAAARGSEVREVLPEAADKSLTDGFRYVEHLENVALALAVCEHLGVATETAVKGMREATPDPGALFVHRVREDGKEIEFVSAFAANDRDSTVAIWNTLDPRSDPDRTVIVVASLRADRPDRVLQFGEIIAEDLPADYYVLGGGMTRTAKSIATQRGIDPAKIHDLGGKPPEEIYRKVVELTTDRSLVVGVGNIVGFGGQVLAQFRERSEKE
jgi:poly-gamma-glutamate synthase PgsB/CapB